MLDWWEFMFDSIISIESYITAYLLILFVNLFYSFILLFQFTIFRNIKILLDLLFIA